MELIYRVDESFGVRLAPRAIFDQPTIAETAKVIENLILEEIEKISEGDAISMTNNFDK
jgi:hypothetical protein